MMDGSIPPSSSRPLHHHHHPHPHAHPHPHIHPHHHPHPYSTPPLPHPHLPPPLPQQHQQPQSQQVHQHHLAHQLPHQHQHHQHHHPPSSSSSSSSTIPTTLSSASSSSSSSAAVFRPRRSDDWQQYRPIIEQLYLNNQLKLRDVKIIMEREHHFVASEKQYKDRLAAWHIRKNIKAKEVHVMIRKQQKRAARGKQTAFRVGGQEVDSKRISRFVRRYGSTWEPTGSPNSTAAVSTPTRGRFGDPKSPQVSYSPEPDTPTDMSCYTPEPDDRPSALSPMPEIPGDPRTLEPSALDHLPHHELPDDQSLSATLSPGLTTTTNDTPKASSLDDDLHEEDPWSALVSFQDRLLVLHQTLEQSMSDYSTPLDD